jgi:hypothetical protein
MRRISFTLILFAELLGATLVFSQTTEQLTTSGTSDLSQVLLRRDERPGLYPIRQSYLGWSFQGGIARSEQGIGGADISFLYLPKDSLGLLAVASVIDRAGTIEFRAEAGSVAIFDNSRLSAFGTLGKVRLPHKVSGSVARLAVLWEMPLGNARLGPFVSIPVLDSDFDNSNAVETPTTAGLAGAIDLGHCHCIGLQGSAAYLDSDQRRFAATGTISFRLAEYLGIYASIGGDEQPLGPHEIGRFMLGVRFGNWNELRFAPGRLRVDPILVPFPLSYQAR